MLADRDARDQPLQHLQLQGHLVRDAEQVPFDQARHVLTHEQVVQVGIATVAVQVHDLGPRHREPAAPQHVHLDRDVRDVLDFQTVGRFDFDHPVTVRRALQDVHLCVGVVGEERGLVDGGRVAAQRVARRGDLVVVLVEGKVDELAAGDVAACHAAHLGTLVEAVAQRRRRHQLRRLGLVHPPPQLLVTLDACDESGLGETQGHGGHRMES